MQILEAIPNEYKDVQVDGDGIRTVRGQSVNDALSRHAQQADVSSNNILRASRALDEEINRKIGKLTRNVHNLEVEGRSKSFNDCSVGRTSAPEDGQLEMNRAGASGVNPVNHALRRDYQGSDESYNSILRSTLTLDAAINQHTAISKQRLNPHEVDEPACQSKEGAWRSEGPGSAPWWVHSRSSLTFTTQSSNAEPSPAEDLPLHGKSKSFGPSSVSRMQILEAITQEYSDVQVDGNGIRIVRGQSANDALSRHAQQADVSSNNILRASRALDEEINRKIGKLTRNMHRLEDERGSQMNLGWSTGLLRRHQLTTEKTGIVAGQETPSEAWDEDPVSPATSTLQQAVNVWLTWLPWFELMRRVLGAAISVLRRIPL